MNNQRLERILENLKARNLSQMVISDPSSIFYLTGKRINPGERFLALLVRSDGNHKIFINELFTVPEDLGVEKIRFSDSDDGAQILSNYTDKDKPLGIDKVLSAKFLLRIMECGAADGYVNSSVCVDEARGVKDDEEQLLMQAASNINDKAMAMLKTKIRAGMTEMELASYLADIYKGLGASGYSFEPLVGFGKNAAVGHYEPGCSRLSEGDCILIDMGCVKDGYCSDMTRTFFFKTVSERHREIYELVRKAQQAAIDIIKPGVRFCDIDKAARDVIASAGYGENFNHRLGHFIGIECHEYGDVSSANKNVTEPGMCFSIEPGIYIDGDVGVRIEDLVMVTDKGVKVLNSYTKELEII